MNLRRTSAALMSAAALTVTGVAMAQPASAAPLVTGGLVNVTVSDVDLLNDNDVDILNDVLNRNRVNVGVVAQIAATVCDTNIGGVLGSLRDTGRATCSTAEGTTFDFAQAAS